MSNNIEYPDFDAIKAQAESFDYEAEMKEKEKEKVEILVTSFINGNINFQGVNKRAEAWLEFNYLAYNAERNYYSPGYTIRSNSNWDSLKKEINDNLQGVIKYADPKIPWNILKYNTSPDYQIIWNEGINYLLLKHNKVNSDSLVMALPSCKYKSLYKEDNSYKAYTVSLSDSIKLIEFLNIQLEKYARKSKWDDKSLTHAQSILSEKIKRDSLITNGQAPEIGNPFSEKFPNAEGASIKLRPFQQVAIAFAEATDGCMLNADEVGLGKSLDFIGYAVRNDLRTLCITKASLAANLKAEIIKLTGRNPLVLKGLKPTEFDIKALLLGTEQFVIINYTILGQEFKTKEKDENGDLITKQYWVDLIKMAADLKSHGKIRGFDLIVADEAHLIRNMESSRSKAVLKLANAAEKRISLTATPVVNGVGDYYPILHFIRPDIFHSYSEFINTYSLGDGRTPRNEKELQEMLKSFMIRRTKRDVMKDLPKVGRYEKIYELSEDAWKKYDKAEKGVYEVLKTFDPEKQGSEFQINGVLAMLIRLKQIVAEDKIEFTSDLALELSDSARDAKSDYSKVLIFSQFVPVVKALAKSLGYDSGEALYITGEDHPSAQDKKDVVDKFMNDKHGNYNFLVCSTAAMSEGFNITSAGYVVFNDLMWTPAAHEQAEGRAYGRLNDPHPIDSYYILGENTIDDMIWKILHRKWKIIDSVVEGVERDRIKGASIAGELMKMLRNKFQG